MIHTTLNQHHDIIRTEIDAYSGYADILPANFTNDDINAIADCLEHIHGINFDLAVDKVKGYIS